MELPPFEELFKIIKTTSCLIGMPFNSPPKPLLFLLMVVSLSLTTLAEIAYISFRKSTASFVELTQLAPCTCIGVLSIIKMLYVFYKREKVFKLVSMVEDLYRDIRLDEKKSECVKKEIFMVKNLTKYYYLLNTMLTSSYNFSVPLLIMFDYFVNNHNSFALPYALFLPFEINTWIRWIIVYSFEVATGFICVAFFSTADALYYNLTCNVSINFSVLNKDIENIETDDVAALKHIIRKHQYFIDTTSVTISLPLASYHLVLKVVDKMPACSVVFCKNTSIKVNYNKDGISFHILSEYLEDIFSGPNFFNSVIQSIIICSLGFNLTAGELADIPGCIIFLGSALIQILMMSVFGENLIYESGRITDTCYLCKWYEMNEENKKLILLIRQRALKPQCLTAYKFSVISYASFSKIISTAWSYFTILNTVYDPVPVAEKTLTSK